MIKLTGVFIPRWHSYLFGFVVMVVFVAYTFVVFMAGVWFGSHAN